MHVRADPSSRTSSTLWLLSLLYFAAYSQFNCNFIPNYYTSFALPIDADPQRASLVCSACRWISIHRFSEAQPQFSDSPLRQINPPCFYLEFCENFAGGAASIFPSYYITDQCIESLKNVRNSQVVNTIREKIILDSLQLILRCKIIIQIAFK